MYYQGSIVRDRKIIMETYLKNDFIFDMMSLFPTIVYITPING
jgi:hypothetical protein